jgi:transcriptional regulator GlxA family with amidase domain
VKCAAAVLRVRIKARGFAVTTDAATAKKSTRGQAANRSAWQCGLMTEQDWPERILRAIHYVQAHSNADIAPADLARIAAFSPHHFHRNFRGMVGESVMGYVRCLRLERSAFRLK